MRKIYPGTNITIQKFFLLLKAKFTNNILPFSKKEKKKKKSYF